MRPGCDICLFFQNKTHNEDLIMLTLHSLLKNFKKDFAHYSVHFFENVEFAQMPANALWLYGYQQETILYFYGFTQIALGKTLDTIMENDP